MLVYTHYVDGIDKTLRDALADAGLRVGLLTGDTEKDDLEQFLDKDGSVDVLIASSRIGTGVNGLQYVCQKLIINALPWTNAEYEQLVGRLFRQGSRFDRVEVIIPVTFAMVNGQRWSYCESKLHRLEYKKSIADAAVDGIVPEGNLRTPAQAQQDVMDWLSRLETGQMGEVARAVIKIPLDGTPADAERRVRRYGDFSKMNNRWYATDSVKTHDRLANNPEEWARYHTLYRQLRETWPVVPFKEEIRWLSERDGYIVGDFGCGEAFEDYIRARDAWREGNLVAFLPGTYWLPTEPASEPAPGCPAVCQRRWNAKHNIAAARPRLPVPGQDNPSPAISTIPVHLPARLRAAAMILT